jgi:hypothetical protein
MGDAAKRRSAMMAIGKMGMGAATGALWKQDGNAVTQTRHCNSPQ